MVKKRDLIIDAETESKEDIKLGAYAYNLNPSTETMCISWRFIEERIGTERTWYPDFDINPAFVKKARKLIKNGLSTDYIRDMFLKGKLPTPFFDRDENPMPDELRESLERGDRWWSFNAFFERSWWELIMVRKYGWPSLHFDAWWCISALAGFHGFAQQLERCCKGMKLDIAKDLEGGELLKKMMNPSKRSKKILEAWDFNLFRLGEYCNVDVAAEGEIIKNLPPMPKKEREIWLTDQQINWHGLLLDRELVTSAANVNSLIQEDARKRMLELTEGELYSPNQHVEIKNWVNERIDTEIFNLRAPTVSKLLEDPLIDETLEQVLIVRQDAGTAAIKKFAKAAGVIKHDETSRFRGGYIYYGAHTGRWTGKIIQPANMPRLHFNDNTEVNKAVAAIISEDMDAMEEADEFSLLNAKEKKLSKGFKWDDEDDGWRPSVTNCLTKSVRPAIIAPPGKTLVAADFAGIELRVLTWYVDDKEGLKRITEKGSSQLYIDMAEKIFKCSVSKADTFRYTVGKSARLGCGYQMSGYKKEKNEEGVLVPAINEEGDHYGGFMDYAGNYGIKVTCALADEAVSVYRAENKKVVSSWKKTQRRVKSVIQEGFTMSFNGVKFKMQGPHLVIVLPSRRELWYPFAGIQKTGRKSAFYWGDKQRKWVKCYLYGGLIIENIIQAISRCLFVDAMLKIAKRYQIVSHTYDEIVCEVRESEAKECADFMDEMMCKRPRWAKDLPLETEIWINKRYKK